MIFPSQITGQSSLPNTLYSRNGQVHYVVKAYLFSLRHSLNLHDFVIFNVLGMNAGIQACLELFSNL